MPKLRQPHMIATRTALAAESIILRHELEEQERMRLGEGRYVEEERRTLTT
jgi:hypothetical protein